MYHQFGNTEDSINASYSIIVDFANNAYSIDHSGFITNTDYFAIYIKRFIINKQAFILSGLFSVKNK